MAEPKDKKKDNNELSEEDKAYIQQGKDQKDINLAGEMIDKILKQTNCYIAPDGNSPLNNIGIIIVKKPEPIVHPQKDEEEEKK